MTYFELVQPKSVEVTSKFLSAVYASY